jgi:putative spermidine/putrescine transport system ATP-binding protein
MIAALHVQAVTKTFDAGKSFACHAVELELRDGELLCLLGPSGCGKSTLLKLIGGYLQPDAGRIFINGRDTTADPPDRKSIGMVFQSYALFPHLSAQQNVEFGLRMRGVGKAERAARAIELMRIVGLSTEEIQRYPQQLSGGQQQRVAIARALVIEPALVLLDEPMANLDRRLRERMRAEIKRIQRATSVPAILVTHDQEEALSIGDRVAVMHQGRILQCDVPESVYRRPNSVFVGRFLGDINLFPVSMFRDQASANTGAPSSFVAVRPEHVRLGHGGRTDDISLRGCVSSTTYAGPTRVIALHLSGGQEVLVRVLADGAAPREGEDCTVSFRRADTWAVHD